MNSKPYYLRREVIYKGSKSNYNINGHYKKYYEIISINQYTHFLENKKAHFEIRGFSSPQTNG